ncbi:MULTISPECIES: Z1 domain-containing protein [Streptomycetaceae]|uniref:Z1 domain-containing protein n=1 Tax=Streptomycetaceae TaxID=2062 RepID=UPI000939732F|nr:Z1 domain-containing protein [Streptomyces sp. CB02056]OKI11190.1 endonuclease [Streptomyces sp. CB02056]
MNEFDLQYEAFKQLIKQKTPEQALSTIRLFGMSEELVRRIAERHQQETIKVRDMRQPGSVVRNNRETWYVGPQEGDRCWPALQNLLGRTAWDEESVQSLDEASTKVVSMLDHPLEKSFSTRGLVVGYVQSGKTTNFTALIAKAADVGYKFFIVLAGMHNGLRRQTQLRLQDQLVDPVLDQWHTLTKAEGDFEPHGNPAAFFAQSNGQHVLCVVKKNVPRLKKLRSWLEQAPDYLKTCPTLIIDDEADQASVASKTTNPLIREIIDLFPRGGYVGYTATPFANLLIDPAAGDLYPKDFIVNLPKPKGHFGTEVLFGRQPIDGEDPEDVPDGYDMIRTVPYEEIPLVRPGRDEIDGFVPEIEGALRDSVLYFWLATAARRFRGTGNRHSTMLVHTSVGTAVHESFKAPLEDFREEVAALVEHRDTAALGELRSLWGSETCRVDAGEFDETETSFDELLEHLPAVLAECRIILDNSTSLERLDYENGPVTAIAVGGNTLSRGLTLEGLIVSYFVRGASTYDTLLQMGRWFGFRNGYADLPRVWMTDDLRDSFRHIAMVEAEMRRDIDRFLVEDKTPETFAVRLRSHPSLRITAAAKMRDAIKASSSYGGQRIQTRYFHTHDAAWLRANQEAAGGLLRDALQLDGARHEDHTVHGRPGRHVLRDVSHGLVLRFLNEYRFHEKSMDCDTKLLREYIEKRTRASNGGGLRRWNVAVVGNAPSGSSDMLYEFVEGIAVDRIVRARQITADPATADIKTLMNPIDAGIDLDLEGWSGGKVTEDVLKQLRQTQLPDTGLLVLYPIDRVSPTRRKKRLPLDAVDHVIGVGMVFPVPRGEDTRVDWYSADLSGVVQDDDLDALPEEDLSAVLYEEQG